MASLCSGPLDPIASPVPGEQNEDFGVRPGAQFGLCDLALLRTCVLNMDALQTVLEVKGTLWPTWEVPLAPTLMQPQGDQENAQAVGAEAGPVDLRRGSASGPGRRRDPGRWTRPSVQKPPA